MTTRRRKARPEGDLLSTQDVMDLLGVARPTLWQWHKRGKLVPVPLPEYIDKGPRYYRRSDVERLMGIAQQSA